MVAAVVGGDVLSKNSGALRFPYAVTTVPSVSTRVKLYDIETGGHEAGSCLLGARGDLEKVAEDEWGGESGCRSGSAAEGQRQGQTGVVHAIQ